MPNDGTQLALMVAALATVSSILVQVVKILWVDAAMPDSTKRDVTIRALNFIVNLLLLCGVLWAQHQFDVSNIMAYMLAASGSAVLANVAQQTLSLPSVTKPPTPPAS